MSSYGYGHRIETHHRNQPFKTIAITLQVVASHLQSFKTVIHKLQDRAMHMRIEAFNSRAGLGTDKWVWVIIINNIILVMPLRNQAILSLLYVLLAIWSLVTYSNYFKIHCSGVG